MSAIQAKIEGWLDQEGIPFELVPDMNSIFHIRAQMKNLQVHVNESRVRLGCLSVQGIMALDLDQRELVKKGSDEEKHALFLSMFRELEKEEYMFQISEDFLDPNWLRIQRTLYAEDLTRTALLEEMKELNTKFVRLNYELNEALDKIGQAT